MMGVTPNVGPTLVSLNPNTALNDAFSRLRVSDPVTLFDSQQQYGSGASNLYWDNLGVGTGAISDLLNESTVLLTTGGVANGAGWTRQTRQSIRYQPGHSQLVLATFCMVGGAKTDVRRRVGLFDGSDGIFLELAGSTTSVVRRTSTSGAPVDVAVAQADWNIDNLLGSGNATNLSGLTLDLSLTQILVIDLQWLGVGRVRIGFDIGGVIVYVHEFLNANNIQTSVYMKTACLPIRYEIHNTGGGSGSPTTFKHICSTVISEGGFESERGLQYAHDRGATPVVAASGVFRPIIAIRAKTTGPAGVRNTGQILPKAFDLMAGTNSAVFRVIYNPTTLTVGGVAVAWTAFNASISLAETNITADAYTGGTIIDSGNTPAGGGGARGISGSEAIRRLELVYTGLTNTQDVLVVVAAGVGGNSSLTGSIIWQELY